MAGEKRTHSAAQVRVITDKNDLQVKMGKMLQFQRTAAFRNLKAPEKDRQERQLAAMNAYLGVLKERIHAFRF